MDLRQDGLGIWSGYVAGQRIRIWQATKAKWSGAIEDKTWIAEFKNKEEAYRTIQSHLKAA